MTNKKLDRLVPPGRKARGLFKKIHRAVDEAGVQMQLPLTANPHAPPPLKRRRRRGPQMWLGEQ